MPTVTGISVEFDNQSWYGYEAHGIERALEIIRESAALGTLTRVEFTYKVCPTCNGNGATGPAHDPDSCNSCRGTGVA